MTERPDRGSPADWLRYARSDLDMATAAPWGHVLLETLAYHAQQAAEKALKAVLLHVGHEAPPHTHNLARLVHALSPHVEVPLSPAAIEGLTRYAVLTRYPADVGEIDDAEWRRAVADARTVVAWAEGVIGENAPDAPRS